MKDRNLALVSILVLVVFGVLSVLKVNMQPDKTFTETGYYKGTRGTETDPKLLYQSLVSNDILSTMRCKTGMAKVNYEANVYGNYWVKEKVDILKDSEYVSSLSCSEDGSVIYNAFDDGNRIVAPFLINQFVDANIDYTNDAEINITLISGSGVYKIEFIGVKCWWCHDKVMPKDRSVYTRHTEKYGAGGKYATCEAGYRIGVAKSTTEVRMYRYDTVLESWEPYSIFEYYQVTQIPNG